MASGTPLPAGVAALEYLVAPERTYAWLREGTRSHFAEVPAGRRELARLVAAVTPPRFEAGAAARLRDLLVRPFEPYLEQATRLVLVPDGPLHGLSFAALPGRRARYLVEEHAAVVAPSIRSWQAWTAGLADAPAVRSALAIGNPAFSREAFPALADLSSADAEVRAVAGIYPSGALLSGAAASRERLIAGFGRADVVHYAGHAIANAWTPSASMLVVGQDGLRAGEIRRLDLRGTRLVVLAACQSAGTAGGETEGPLGLARAFLAAGSPAVLASRWPLPDDAALPLMVEFHQRYRDTGDAALALQHAQVSYLRASSGSSSPAAWSGLVVIAAGRIPAGMEGSY